MNGDTADCDETYGIGGLAGTVPTQSGVLRVVIFLVLNKPQPVVLFELVKGMITGKKPNLRETERIEGDEIRA